MKRIALFLLSIFILALVCAMVSCTKDKSSSYTSSSDYSCNCEIHWNGGTSTTSTRYGNVTASEATSQCNDELHSLQAKYGYGTSSTGSQWVACKVQ